MTGPTAILVHGLWMTGAELFMLKKWLRADGFHVYRFRYSMVRQPLEHNIGKLNEFIRSHAAGETHLVGHSLGGVLALQTLQRFPDLPVARVVCLGSPLTDTVAGRRFVSFGAGRRMVGKTLPEAIFEEPLVEWKGKQPVGVLAGTRGFGIGKLTGRLPRPNDGVVTLAETCLPGITDHMVLTLSHTGLVVSKHAAKQCAWFLRHGTFKR
ncbi:MAG: alpha/beta hydrolase [Gammaproteobacteria bacterium]|jgi:pimeloyl-ACP methyl ester carboxylesterase|nr:alpha/beta hydrolase [Gammaproteobacteria bacterium]MDP6615551.1 alpha/beta hydrolase [Gammaproteobacteria bacterium]MDP6694775.1 alpha/beta hydrolase [Gammaproteobacteria bacterium]